VARISQRSSKLARCGQNLHKLIYSRAKNFIHVAIDNDKVSDNDLFEVPTKYPLQRRANAPVIGNGRPIKTSKSTTGKIAGVHEKSAVNLRDF
jgi:hypothetical protein